MKALLTLLACACVAQAAWVQPVDLLIEAYQGETTWEARRVAFQKIAESAGAVPPGFYARALSDVMAAREARALPREEAARAALKLQIVRQLGLARDLQSADAVYQLYLEEREFDLRGAALEALGRMGSRAHLRPIAETLARLAISPEGGAPGEAVALGAIAGLEALGVADGYPAVFYASFGRHSAAVHRRAQEALAAIAPDPTEILEGVVARDPVLAVRLEALSVQVASRAAAERKIRSAVAALADLGARRLATEEERRLATRIRGVAVQALIDQASRADDALPLLDAIVREEPDANVRLIAIHAMGVTGTDRAVSILTQSLSRLNDRQEAGDRLDERIVRATIRALGIAGKRAARAEVFRVKLVGYGSGIVREADQALEQLR